MLWSKHTKAHHQAACRTDDSYGEALSLESLLDGSPKAVVGTEVYRYINFPSTSGGAPSLMLTTFLAPSGCETNMIGDQLDPHRHALDHHAASRWHYTTMWHSAIGACKSTAWRTSPQLCFWNAKLVVHHAGKQGRCPTVVDMQLCQAMEMVDP